MNAEKTTEHIESSFRTARSWFASVVSDNPPLAVSAMYVLVSVTGLAYSWRLSAMFDLNVLYYADITDFLMASIRRPVSILLFIGSLLLMYSTARFDIWLRGKWAAYNRIYPSKRVDKVLFSPWVLGLVVVLVAGVYVSRFAEKEAGAIMAGGGSRVRVSLVNAAEPPQEAGLPEDPCILIDTTTRYVILYDLARKNVRIVPCENIAQIVPIPVEKEIVSVPEETKSAQQKSSE